MTSEAQKTSGYPLPPIVATDIFVCLQMKIPDKPEYRAAVLGALTTLGQWWSWQKDYITDSQGGKAAAEIWRKTIFETLEIGGMCMDCCDDIVSINNQVKTIINNQSVNNITNTQNMVNDYSTVISNYAASAGNITILYPQVATISATTDEVMCLATEALVKMICDYRRERNKDAQVVNTVISVGFAIGAAAVTLFSGGTFLALGLGLASTGAALGATLYQVADAILDNTAAQKTVACAIYQNIKGVPVTKAVFTTMADGLGFGALTSEGQITELVRQFLTSDNAHATFMTMAEQQHAYAALGLLECDCIEPVVVTIEYNFINGTKPTTTLTRLNDQQWQIQINAANGTFSGAIQPAVGANPALLPDLLVTTVASPPNVEYGLNGQTFQSGLPQNVLGYNYLGLSIAFGNNTTVLVTAPQGIRLDIDLFN